MGRTLLFLHQDTVMMCLLSERSLVLSSADMPQCDLRFFPGVRCLRASYKALEAQEEAAGTLKF